MSTSFQGASGPSGHAGSRPAFGQPPQVVSVNHIPPQPALTRLKQVSPELPILREIRRLTVRSSIDASDLRANKLSGGIILPLKCHCHSMRCVLIPSTKYTPDRSEVVVCDKGKDRHFVEVGGQAGLRDR